MNYQSLNFGVRRVERKNVKKGLKVEIVFKIYIIILSFVNLYVVQKEQESKIVFIN